MDGQRQSDKFVRSSGAAGGSKHRIIKRASLKFFRNIISHSIAVSNSLLFRKTNFFAKKQKQEQQQQQKKQIQKETKKQQQQNKQSEN